MCVEVIPFPGPANIRETAELRPPPVDAFDRMSMVDRLIDMAEWADRGADAEQADLLLLAAWSMYDDRREYVRGPVRLRVDVTVDGIVRAAYCVNLSVGGALLQCDEPLPDTGDVALAFTGLPVLTGTILEGRHHVRIRFTDLSSDWQAALELFVGERLARPHQVREALGLGFAQDAALG